MPFKDLNIKKEGEFTIENKKEATIEDKIIKCVSSIKFRVNELSYLKFQYELHHEENQDILNKINNIIKILNIEFVSSIDDLNATLKGLYKEDKTIYKDKKEYKDIDTQTDNTGNIVVERSVQTEKLPENKTVIIRERPKEIINKPVPIIRINNNPKQITSIQKEIKANNFEQDVMRYTTKTFRDKQDRKLIKFFDTFVKGKKLEQIKIDIDNYVTNEIQNNNVEEEEAEDMYNRMSKYINEVNKLKENTTVLELYSKYKELEQNLSIKLTKVREIRKQAIKSKIQNNIDNNERFDN